VERSLDVAIVTKSASRLAHFYRDVVGLEPAGDVRISGVLPDGLLMRFRVGASVLKILQFDLDPAESSPEGPVSEATGMRYITVGVDDLEECLERCDAANVQVELPLTALGADLVIAFVRDPDRNLVELVGPARK
jgi:catechol 2,3-dioxygenase-like lactoylglutathione lyase family enzyme